MAALDDSSLMTLDKSNAESCADASYQQRVFTSSCLEIPETKDMEPSDQRLCFCFQRRQHAKLMQLIVSRVERFKRVNISCETEVSVTFVNSCRE